MSSPVPKPTQAKKKPPAPDVAGPEKPEEPPPAKFLSELPTWWRGGVCILALLTLALAFGLPRYTTGLDFGDEGLLSYGAARVMEGQVPNRDFVSLQPPLSFYTCAIAFKIFGMSLRSLRLLGLAIYCALPLLSYGLARRWTGPWVAAIAGVPSLVLGISFAHFVPVAAWQGVVFYLAAALLFVAASSAPGRRGMLALFSGVFTAATVLTRQDQGLYLVLSLLFFAAVTKFTTRSPRSATDQSVALPVINLKILGLWVAGAGCLLVPLGVYWLSVGAVAPMYQQLVRFPLTTYSKTSSLPFPSFQAGAGLRTNAQLLLYYMPPLVCLGSVLTLIRRKVRHRFSLYNAGWLFFAVWAGLSYCQVLVRTDMDHLLIALPPFFILCACAGAELLRALNSKLASASVTLRRVGLSISAGLPLAALLWFLLLLKPEFLPAPLSPSDTIELSRAGVRKGGAANLKKFIERIQAFTPPNQSLLCLPYQPMFYFLAERRNPTRWNYLWPGDQTPADHLALIEQARQDPPAVVIITKEPEMQRYAPAILDYVHQDYQLGAVAGGMFWFYVKK